MNLNMYLEDFSLAFEDPMNLVERAFGLMNDENKKGRELKLYLGTVFGVQIWSACFGQNFDGFEI